MRGIQVEQGRFPASFRRWKEARALSASCVEATTTGSGKAGARLISLIGSPFSVMAASFQPNSRKPKTVSWVSSTSSPCRKAN